MISLVESFYFIKNCSISMYKHALVRANTRRMSHENEVVLGKHEQHDATFPYPNQFILS